MEELTYYTKSSVKENGMKNDNFILIPIQKILFDLGMKQKVNETCDDKAKQYKIKILKRDPLPLNKWNTVLSDVQKKIPLDPIIAKQFKETLYYEVVNGRHRVVSSLYEGYTHVPVIIN